MAMKMTTPYSERPAGERERERRCMHHVLSKVERPQRVLEAFGGIGMTAQLMTELWPGVRVLSTELDVACCNQYAARALPTAKCLNVSCVDMLKETDWGLSDPLGISLDFNQLTLLDLKKPGSFQNRVLDLVFGLNPDWIQITDSAVSKLHLNWRSYRLDEEHREARHYLTLVYEEISRRWPCKCVAVARHSAASYMTFESRRQRRSLQLPTIQVF